MRDDPRELGRDYAKHLASLRDLDAEQPLSPDCKRYVVSDRVQVIFAISPRDDLIVLAVLANLLEAAVEIADMRYAANDGFSVELENKAKHAVRRGMLRPDVDQHVIAGELGLD
jgi:hypothetical protein